METEVTVPAEVGFKDGFFILPNLTVEAEQVQALHYKGNMVDVYLHGRDKPLSVVIKASEMKPEEITAQLEAAKYHAHILNQLRFGPFLPSPFDASRDDVNVETAQAIVEDMAEEAETEAPVVERATKKRASKKRTTKVT